ncbi:hypothetical protein [Herbaspirillum rubrisubalbicans]|uniref:hypothetical protein n=1 Tax=Herbaspirillum rubrisubalbicans TaxID=80842 RepID=UPI0012FE0645|nr:hypothetical protein [Herbaspirillum rubrisubalbicans]
MEIDRSTFYRAQHITGPAAVLISIKFGNMPAEGPTVLRILSKQATEPTPKFDVENHLAEILAGVAQANHELDGRLEVQAVEIIPDDYPRKFQAQHIAYKIACAVLKNQV